MMKKTTTYTVDAFNELLEIQKATEIVQSGGLLKENLGKIGEMFIKYGVEKYWGLALLHRHFFVGKDEFPMTKVLELENNIEYKSEPQNFNFHENYWPSIFSFNCGQEFIMQPLEFSTDSLAKECNELLDKKVDFLLDFKNFLLTESLENIFGIICVKRAIADDTRFVEHNFDDRVSLLKITKVDEINKLNLGETSWYFNSSTNPVTCVYCPLDTDMHHLGPKYRYHR
ncbi:MAG: hypothetical protein ACO1PI_09245 [Bacteroidota bacterium]